MVHKFGGAFHSISKGGEGEDRRASSLTRLGGGEIVNGRHVLKKGISDP
jgi:hypothetical protein